jgi:hypothetical protein
VVAPLADPSGDRGGIGRHLKALAEGLGEALKQRSGQAWPVVERSPPLLALLVTSRCCLSYKAKSNGFPKVINARYRCAGLRLHGIGFGLFEGGFMGLAQVGVDAVAGAAALADQRGTAALADGDAHPGCVGDAPARLLVPARASGTDEAFALVDAAEGDGFALPAIKAKDPVGFCDQLSSLHRGWLPVGPTPRGRAGAAACDARPRRGP